MRGHPGQVTRLTSIALERLEGRRFRVLGVTERWVYRTAGGRFATSPDYPDIDDVLAGDPVNVRRTFTYELALDGERKRRRITLGRESGWLARELNLELVKAGPGQSDVVFTLEVGELRVV